MGSGDWLCADTHHRGSARHGQAWLEEQEVPHHTRPVQHCQEEARQHRHQVRPHWPRRVLYRCRRQPVRYDFICLHLTLCPCVVLSSVDCCYSHTNAHQHVIDVDVNLSGMASAVSILHCAHVMCCQVGTVVTATLTHMNMLCTLEAMHCNRMTP